MKGIWRLSIVMSLGFVMAGCGASKMAVRPDATTHINTIALIQVAEPETYVANDFGNPGMMFGAVGGAVAGASSANAGKNLYQIISESGYAAGDDFTQSLQAKLSSAGYQVKVVAANRTKRTDLIEDYQAVDAAGADAILDVAIESIGYATEHPMFSPFWRPASMVKVALVDRASGKKIYTEKFMYGYHNPFMSGTDLDAPDTYHFKNKDSLFADSQKLIAGMEDSITTVSSNVASNLKK